MRGTKEPVVLVDIDGTLTLRGERDPYDWDRVGEDAPNAAVVTLVRMMAGCGTRFPCTELIRDHPDDLHRWMDLNSEPVLKRTCDLAEVGGQRIILMSGRDERCRRQTEAYLGLHDIPSDGLFMRTAKDNRKDSVVKHELYHRWIEPVYDVQLVVDDRQQVVDMWRSELGLPCLQVAEGNF
ncbi:phosphatase domain-containing protein [Micromonospora fluostatini]|uniref:phosphatase domain-containing protein n=1 Tax=Micromonospora sp. JCM 30529 TaxID=3421643 RepID=UPI003D185341